MAQNPKYDQHSHFLPLKWSCNPSCRSLFVLTQHWATASVLLAMEVSSEERSASSCEGWDLHRAVSASLAASMSALCCCTMPCRSCKAMERLYVKKGRVNHVTAAESPWGWVPELDLKGWCYDAERESHKSAETINWVICIWIIWVLLKVRVYLILGAPVSRIHISYVYCYFLFLSYLQWKNVWLNELWDAESINNMSHLKCSNVAVRCGTGEVR